MLQGQGGGRAGSPPLPANANSGSSGKLSDGEHHPAGGWPEKPRTVPDGKVDEGGPPSSPGNWQARGQQVLGGCHCREVRVAHQPPGSEATLCHLH